jgi:drug/metabolite transporter (DMT)-like permease
MVRSKPATVSPSKAKAFAAITITVFFWGLSFVATKAALPVFPPMSLGAVRHALALVFMFVIKQRLAPGEKLRLADLPRLALSGLLGITLYYYFENSGIALVSASEASIIIAAIPVFTLAVDAIIGRKSPCLERVALLRRWGGALVSVFGVVLVAGVSFYLSGNFRGYFFMAGACASFTAFGFVTRPLFKHCSQIQVTFWQTFFGFIGFLPFTFPEIQAWGRINLVVFMNILFLALCCSALGYWFYNMAIDVLGVSVASVYNNFMPVVTAVAAFFILGERLSPLQWLGAALTIIGVSLAVFEPKSKTKLGQPRSGQP